MDDTQKEVLRKNHNLLVNSLDLTATHVLDKLQQEDVISADEQEDILSRKVKKDQNARLLFLLKRINASKQPFESFINILAPNYAFIADELRKSYANCSSDLRAGDKNTPVKCFYCQLIDNLIPNYVSHHLYEKGVITDDELEELSNSNIPRIERVKKLIEIIDRNLNKHVWEIFCRSLQPKYGYLLTRLGSSEVCLRCICVTASNGQRLSELKLNESIYPGRVQELENAWEQAFENNLDGTLKLKLLTLQARKDLDQYDGCEFNENNHQYNTKQKNDRRRRKDLNQCKCVTSFTQEGNAGSGVSPMRCRKDHDRQDGADKEDIVNKQIVRRPGSYHNIGVMNKTLPNERKLMTLCAKLWEKLFQFREEGNWEMFYQFSKTSMEYFATNPDVLVSLYRSEMAVATFYKYDKVKAYGFYEKAIDVIPKTTIPTWHLGRLLPLKMMLLSKDRNFDEASCLSDEIQQTVTTLGPCLSTACANFFEALYLENILRCTRKDSTSAKRLAERVKQCFLTAIDHFHKEPYFPMQSFLNQVYLFLALFSLGVDFKYSSYVNSIQVNEHDIEIAEHYLNKFENGCWDKSTNWSRMLFFIARGEQHKRRNNFGRSLDYFKEAHSCALVGAYTDQINFIRVNIEALEARQKQCSNKQPQTQENVNYILQQVLDSAGE